MAGCKFTGFGGWTWRSLGAPQAEVWTASIHPLKHYAPPARAITPSFTTDFKFSVAQRTHSDRSPTGPSSQQAGSASTHLLIFLSGNPEFGVGLRRVRRDPAKQPSPIAPWDCHRTADQARGGATGSMGRHIFHTVQCLGI